MAKRRILIVADEIKWASDIAVRLTQLGYEVAAIASIEQAAIEIRSQATPDLVLMDVAADGVMQGLRAADDFQAQGTIPVVFTIAEGAAEELCQADGTGAFGCIVKPVTTPELRLNIELAFCRHDAAKTFHEMENRFFTDSIDMLCFLDFSGYFKRLNPAWERTLGFTRAELMSRPFIEFVHPDDRERTLNQNATVRGGAQALAFENRYLCKDGSYRWLRWNAAPDAIAKVIYSVARDITASKQAEEDREHLVRELQAALAEVRTLRAILPICSYCRKIRDDENYWHTVETYISRHTSTRFSHGICPSCMASQVRPELESLERE